MAALTSEVCPDVCDVHGDASLLAWQPSALVDAQRWTIRSRALLSGWGGAGGRVIWQCLDGRLGGAAWGLMKEPWSALCVASGALCWRFKSGAGLCGAGLGPAAYSHV